MTNWMNLKSLEALKIVTIKLGPIKLFDHCTVDCISQETTLMTAKVSMKKAIEFWTRNEAPNRQECLIFGFFTPQLSDNHCKGFQLIMGIWAREWE